MTPKILIAAPTSDKKDYCSKDFFNQLKGFTYPNYAVFLVDNSENPNHIKQIWSYGIDALWVEPGGSPIEYIALCQNIIRNKVLSEGYDYLFMNESDVFVPNNILEYLMMYGNEVHTFPYFIMNGDRTALCLQGTENRVLTKGKAIYKQTGRLNPESSFAMITGEIKPINQFKIGHDFELHATGLGACLIHRSVLEKIEFRIVKKNKHIFSDSYFFSDLKKLGINPILDTTLIPEHRRGDAWQTDLRLLN